MINRLISTVNLYQQIKHMTYNMKLKYLYKYESKQKNTSKTVLKNTLKKNRNQLELIFQIYYPDHETEVTPLKTSPKKQRNKILNEINIEG